MGLSPATMHKSEQKTRFKSPQARLDEIELIWGNAFYKFRCSLYVGYMFHAKLYSETSNHDTRVAYRKYRDVAFKIKKLYPWVAEVSTILNERGDMVSYSGYINIKDLFTERRNLYVVPNKKKVIG